MTTNVSGLDGTGTTAEGAGATIPSGAVRALREALEQGRPVAALTGAGVSAESGIPTFRGAGGLWRGFRAEDLATPEAFRRDPYNVWAWYTWRRRLVLEATPNPAHEALATLERVHPNFTLVTQNVDGLHQRAGSEKVVELHGNVHHARCTACGLVEALPPPAVDDEPADAPSGEKVTDAPASNGGIPLCSRCGARTRPHIVWFGEALPEVPWREAFAAASRAAVLLVVGTSAAVYPAAGLVEVTLQSGGVVIEVNPRETEASHRATWVVRQRAGIALPNLLRAADVVES